MYYETQKQKQNPKQKKQERSKWVSWLAGISVVAILAGLLFGTQELDFLTDIFGSEAAQSEQTLVLDTATEFNGQAIGNADSSVMSTQNTIVDSEEHEYIVPEHPEDDPTQDGYITVDAETFSNITSGDQSDGSQDSGSGEGTDSTDSGDELETFPEPDDDTDNTVEPTSTTDQTDTVRESDTTTDETDTSETTIDETSTDTEDADGTIETDTTTEDTDTTTTTTTEEVEARETGEIIPSTRDTVRSPLTIQQTDTTPEMIYLSPAYELSDANNLITGLSILDNDVASNVDITYSLRTASSPAELSRSAFEPVDLNSRVAEGNLKNKEQTFERSASQYVQLQIQFELASENSLDNLESQNQLPAVYSVELTHHPVTQDADDGSQVAQVNINPTSADVRVGEKQQFTAQALDSNGNTVSGASFTWAVKNGPGNITSQGTYHADSTGGATVEVIESQSGVAAEAAVSVSARETSTSEAIIHYEQTDLTPEDAEINIFTANQSGNTIHEMSGVDLTQKNQQTIEGLDLEDSAQYMLEVTAEDVLDEQVQFTKIQDVYTYEFNLGEFEEIPVRVEEETETTVEERLELDLNGDGKINTIDFGIYVEEYGKQVDELPPGLQSNGSNGQNGS